MAASTGLTRGISLAAIAAVSFGITTPVIARVGSAMGPFTIAALLYAGAGVLALTLQRFAHTSGPKLQTKQLARLAIIALFGGAIAPVLLAWGLLRIGATSGSLLLNFEAVFTAVLAWAFFQEAIGRRVLLALTLMSVAGLSLTIDAAATAQWNGLGALAVTAATLAWSIDNVLTRGLSELDPLLVVAGKGALGSMLTGTIAVLMGEPRPGISAAVILFACGATGYGLSLRCYVAAQRHIGAARTASIFALAPFVGAAVAVAMGDKMLSLATVVAAILFAAGVALHLTERHQHRHSHPALEHEHLHRHDDGHHVHHHDERVIGEHSHAHRHEPIAHEHEHSPDLHHRHSH